MLKFYFSMQGMGRLRDVSFGDLFNFFIEQEEKVVCRADGSLQPGIDACHTGNIACYEA